MRTVYGSPCAPLLLPWLREVERRGPALGGPPTYRFYVTRVPGPCMGQYNVQNDRTLGLSAGGV